MSFAGFGAALGNLFGGVASSLDEKGKLDAYLKKEENDKLMRLLELSGKYGIRSGQAPTEDQLVQLPSVSAQPSAPLNPSFAMGTPTPATAGLQLGGGAPPTALMQGLQSGLGNTPTMPSQLLTRPQLAKMPTVPNFTTMPVGKKGYEQIDPDYYVNQDASEMGQIALRQAQRDKDIAERQTGNLAQTIAGRATAANAKEQNARLIAFNALKQAGQLGDDETFDPTQAYEGTYNQFKLETNNDARKARQTLQSSKGMTANARASLNLKLAEGLLANFNQDYGKALQSLNDPETQKLFPITAADLSVAFAKQQTENLRRSTAVYGSTFSVPETQKVLSGLRGNTVGGMSGIPFTNK